MRGARGAWSRTPGRRRAPGIAHMWAALGTCVPAGDPTWTRPEERARAPEPWTVRVTRMLHLEERRERVPRWGSEWPRRHHRGETQTRVETAGGGPATRRAEATQPPRQSRPWGRAVRSGRGNGRGPCGNRLCPHCGGGDEARVPSPAGASGPLEVPGTPARSRSLPAARGRAQTSPRPGPRGLPALPPPLALPAPGPPPW